MDSMLGAGIMFRKKDFFCHDEDSKKFKNSDYF